MKVFIERLLIGITLLGLVCCVYSGCSRSKITVKCTLNHWPNCAREHVGQMCHDDCTLEKVGSTHNLPRLYPPTPRPPGNAQPKEKPKEVSAIRYGFVTGWAKERKLIRKMLEDAIVDGALTDDEYDKISKIHDDEDLLNAKTAVFTLLNSEIDEARKSVEYLQKELKPVPGSGQ